jgi:hypothetical protein
MSSGSSSGGDWRDPNEARDPASADRLEAVDPDGFMRRREFLQRAALTGGMAMSMASDRLQDQQSRRPRPLGDAYERRGLDAAFRAAQCGGGRRGAAGFRPLTR